MGEGAAVGEGDELGEGVGTLRAAEESGVATLRADEGCGFGLRSWDPTGREDARCRVG